jgi:hypothetical protein
MFFGSYPEGQSLQKGCLTFPTNGEGLYVAAMIDVFMGAPWSRQQLIRLDLHHPCLSFCHHRPGGLSGGGLVMSSQ